MNTVDFMRKYADIINEGPKQSDVVQLDEGVVDDAINWAKNKAQELFSKMTPEYQKAIVDLVGQVTGGEKPTFNMDTIKSVAAKLQPQIPAIQQKINQIKGQQQPQATVAEGFRDTLNKWGGTAALAGSAAAGAGTYAANQAATAAGQAASALVPITGWGNWMAYEVAKMGAFNNAALSGQLLSYVLGALCVALAIFSWTEFTRKNPAGNID